MLGRKKVICHFLSIHNYIRCANILSGIRGLTTCHVSIPVAWLESKTAREMLKNA